MILKKIVQKILLKMLLDSIKLHTLRVDDKIGEMLLQ